MPLDIVLSSYKLEKINVILWQHLFQFTLPPENFFIAVLL